MTDSFTVSCTLPVSPQRLFKAWLSGKEHGAMIGDRATWTRNGKFTAWSGYIEGQTLELVDNQRIVQSWRTSDFDESDPDSRLEITLHKVAKGTRLTLKHSRVPEGQGASYKTGWRDSYFVPMADYFSRSTTQKARSRK